MFATRISRFSYLSILQSRKFSNLLLFKRSNLFTIPVKEYNTNHKGEKKNNNFEAILQPEDEPEDDSDFDESKYTISPLMGDKEIPLNKQKKPEFYTHKIPNIDRLKLGKEEYKKGIECLHKQRGNTGLEYFRNAISLFEQYVYYKYGDTTKIELNKRLSEYVVDAYCNYAHCCQAENKYKHSKLYYLKALKILKSDFQKGEQLAQVAMNLSEIYGILQKPDIAVKISSIHLPLAKQFFEPMHYAGAIANLCIYLADSQQREQAVEVGAEAVELFTEHLPLTHPIAVRFIDIYFKLLAIQKEKEIYDDVYAIYSEQTPQFLPYEEKVKEMANVHDKRNEDEEIQKNVEHLTEDILPQLEKATKNISLYKNSGFTDEILSETLSSYKTRKE